MASFQARRGHFTKTSVFRTRKQCKKDRGQKVKSKKGEIPSFSRGQTSSPSTPQPLPLRGRSGDSADGRVGCGQRKSEKANATEIRGYLRPIVAAAARPPGSGTSIAGKCCAGIWNLGLASRQAKKGGDTMGIASFPFWESWRKRHAESREQ